MAVGEDAVPGDDRRAEREVWAGPAADRAAGKYLGNLLQGDFGVSIKMQKNRPVLDIILEMFPVSAKVGIVAICWAVVVGVPLGCLGRL